VGVGGKERHLTFRIPAIGAVRVRLDELPDGETIRGFLGREGSVFAHESMLFDSFNYGKNCHSRAAFGSRNASIPNIPNSRPPPLLRISGMSVGSRRRRSGLSDQVEMFHQVACA